MQIQRKKERKKVMKGRNKTKMGKRKRGKDEKRE